MLETNNAEPEGPFEGSRCAAGPGGTWGLATIRRVNEDGTFQIEFDVKELQIMPLWYGVTAEEISFDDDQQWAAVFAEISADGKTLSEKTFPDVLTRLGYDLDADRSRQLWLGNCMQIFNVTAQQAESLALNVESSYQLFLQLGVSAKQCAENLKANTPKPYFKLYWNQTRMGGRDPGEINRPVTLQDTFAALGVLDRGVDASATALLQEFEREQAIRLPAALKEFICRDGAVAAVEDCHPNDPRWIPIAEWRLQRGMREKGLAGNYAITIIFPHQGDHEWTVVFDYGDKDAGVYVCAGEDEDDQTSLLTAPGLGLFFWDLAQTGLAWYQQTNFNGGRAVEKSDIGLVPSS